MLKLCKASALAMTTCLGGAAFGQVTISGSFDDLVDTYIALNASDAVQTARGAAYSFVVNAANFSFQAPALTAGGDDMLAWFLLATDLDLTQPIPTGESIEGVIDAFLATEGEGRVYDLPIGQTLAVVFLCADASFNCNTTGAYSFTVTGASLLLGPTAAEELAGLIAASGGAARLVVLDAQGIVRDIGAVSLVSRSARLDTELAVKNGGELALSSKSANPGLVGNVYS